MVEAFLSLDLGTKTGFCIWRLEENGNAKIITSGTKNFKTKLSDPFGRRFVLYRNWLKSILNRYQIETVFYEQVYAHNGTQAAHVYGGFLYHMAALCDDFGIKVVGIGVGTIKKRATGNGRASKQEVIEKAIAMGIHPVDDNEADAIAIMCAVVS